MGKDNNFEVAVWIELQFEKAAKAVKELIYSI